MTTDTIPGIARLGDVDWVKVRKKRRGIVNVPGA